MAETGAMIAFHGAYAAPLPDSPPADFWNTFRNVGALMRRTQGIGQKPSEAFFRPETRLLLGRY
jgi:hypothetical protein